MINCLGMKNRPITEKITATRFNKFYLNKRAFDTIYTILKEKLQIKNAASVYQFVNLFNLTSLRNSTLSYTERCFTIISDSKSFLEIEYNLISKILASSNLLITSEIEVFKVANKWLNHNIKQRSKYAEDLLAKIRLHLLSTETIKHLLNDSAFFNKDERCVKILNNMLDCREKKVYTSSSSYHTRRYCNQKYFKLLVCGGRKAGNNMTCSNVNCIDINKLGDVEAFSPMITGRDSQKLIYLKGNVYVIGGLNNKG